MEFRILISTLTILLFSCTKEVKIDVPQFTEKVVVDGIIETGTPPLVLLSKTQNIYSETSFASYLNGFISGAIITVSDGTTSVILTEVCSDNLPPGTEQLAAQIFGIPVSELANYQICAYTSLNPAIWGQVGKSYSLKIETGGKIYESSTTIKNPIPLDSLYWKEEPETPGYGFSWAKLSDPIGKGNYYQWQVKRINNDATGQDKDPSFIFPFNPVFPDDFIDGKTFDFANENPGDRNKSEIPGKFRFKFVPGDSIVVKFSTMDAGVYEFLEKKYQQLQSGGSPFSAPTFIISNITGGAVGVWGGFSPSLDTLFVNP